MSERAEHIAAGAPFRVWLAGEDRAAPHAPARTGVPETDGRGGS